MVNKVTLVGYLGKDPEVRSTQAGQAVATFSVATSRRWKDKGGQKHEETEWHSVVVWGRQAEIAGKYLTKGKMVYVEGRLQTRTWEDRQTGEKRYKTEIVCDSFQMLGGGANGGAGAKSSRPAAAKREDDVGVGDEYFDQTEDDIPF